MITDDKAFNIYKTAYNPEISDKSIDYITQTTGPSLFSSQSNVYNLEICILQLTNHYRETGIDKEQRIDMEILNYLNKIGVTMIEL